MISNPDNQTIKRIRRLRKRAERSARRLYIAEGARAVAATLSVGRRPEVVLHTPAAGERHRRLLLDAGAEGVRVAAAAPEVLKTLTSARAAPDVVAVIPMRPDPTSGDLLVLAGVADPAAVGALLAAAAATGFSGAVAFKGSADPYGSTAVRVAAGAHAVLDIGEAQTAAEVAAGRRGHLVAVRAGGLAPWDVDLGRPLTLFVGQTRGVEEAVEAVAVPPTNFAMPLTLEAAAVMVEACRQRANR